MSVKTLFKLTKFSMNKKYLDQSTSRCGIRIMSKPFSEHNNSHMDICTQEKERAEKK